jgi:hypothetical protein
MRFSSRNKYKSKEVPITIREAAPTELQEFIIQTAYHFGISPKPLRKLICRTLRKSPDAGNWSEFPNIDMEIHQLLDECEWFYIYDVIEELYENLNEEQAKQFQEDINGFFRSNGIGWQLEEGEIKYRGDDKFEEIKLSAVEVLDTKEKPTSKHEIKEAINDLSKKPDADITGAIQHSLAGLECVVREVTGNPKATLGKLINDHPDIVPKPLDTVISKLWGYTSNMGRHVEEGNPPDFEEAELAVSVSASLISYLAKKNFPDETNKEVEWDW